MMNKNEEINLNEKNKKIMSILIDNNEELKEKNKYLLAQLSEKKKTLDVVTEKYAKEKGEREDIQEAYEMMEKHLKERDAFIVELQEKVCEYSKVAEKANFRMEKYRDAYENNVYHLNVAYDQLEMALASNSWKVTEPIRKVCRKFKGTSEVCFIKRPDLREYVIVDALMPVARDSIDVVRKTLDSFLNQGVVEKHLIALMLPETSIEVYEEIFKYANSNVEIDCINVENLNVKEILEKFNASDYISIVFPGDTFATETYSVINSFVANTEFDWAYSDSAYVHNDIVVETRYKPDFSIDTLRSMNYIDGILIINRKMIAKINESMDLGQYYDFILKLTDYSSKIFHIPELLCYRVISKKNICVEEDIAAINAHLRRQGLSGTAIKTETEGVYRVKYELKATPLVSIIIPNKDHVKDLKTCLNSIYKKSTYKNFEIIIVENNSTDVRTFDYYKTLQKKNIKVINFKGAFNYSKINNFGVKQAKGEYYIFLNNDIAVISPDWIQEMLMLCQRTDVGAVGAKLFYPDNRIQHAGVILGVGGVAAHAFRLASGKSNGYMNRLCAIHNVTAVTGACLMMKAATYNHIEGFNEKLPVDFNDVDLCMKIRRLGLNIVFTPFAELYHYESVSRGVVTKPKDLLSFAESVRRFQKDWCVELQNGDPYYNKNFTLNNADFMSLDEEKKKKLCGEIAEEQSITVDLDERKMSIRQKLNQYMDIDNYPRALEVLNHTRRFNGEKNFKDGLSIVILNLNKPELINPLLDNLVAARKQFATEGFVLDILVGDTGSTNSKVLKKYKELSNDVRVIYNMKYNFSACNNEVFEKLATRKYTLFLNNDVVFPDAYACLKTMVKQYENAKIGIVGSFLFYPDKRVQHIGIDFFKTGEAASLCYHPKHMQHMVRPEVGFYSNTPATTGACLMIQSELFFAIDGFDENYIEECQDVALCLAVRRLGYEIITVYSGEVLHLENATRPKGSESWKDRRYFLRKWKSYIEVL